jgi:hypothetical protein
LATIKDGFGFAYLKYPFDADKMKMFIEAERIARNDRKGMWGPITEGYKDIFTPKVSPRAESWIKIGDSLRESHPVGANEWYKKVLDEFPKSTSAELARQRLNLPEKIEKIPTLSRENALSMLVSSDEAYKIKRPALPPPPRPEWALEFGSELSDQAVRAISDRPPANQAQPLNPRSRRAKQKPSTARR